MNVKKFGETFFLFRGWEIEQNIYWIMNRMIEIWIVISHRDFLQMTAILIGRT